MNVQKILSAAAIGLLLTNSIWAEPAPIQISPQEALDAGKRVWKNECSGSVEGLTSWNAGEEFPSLGIGHFIWYPEGKTGKFEESFPGLIRHLESRKVALPEWLLKANGCPWHDRQSFKADLGGPKLTELRKILANNVAYQTEYMALRLQKALPRLLEASEPSQKQEVEERFRKILQSPGGAYCLLDYINFKGEGVNPKERYAGQGWGLLQVLENINPTKFKNSPSNAFADSAEQMMLRRIRNSPPERGEVRWKEGWLNRIQSYRR